MRRNITTPPFLRRLLHTLKQKNSKPLLITVSAALSIGLIFGFLMLQMVHQDKEQATYHVYATTETSEDQQEQTSIDFPELQLFVHQGGVYSNKENAEQLSNRLTKDQIPFTVREADGQYFIWMNLQQTKAGAEEQSKKMDKLGIEVYEKEWNLPAATVYVEEQTATWLEEFVSVVELAMENEVIQQKEIDELVNMEGMPEQVQTWQKRLEQLISDTDSEEQQLLEIIIQYEKVMKDIKE